jgi:hypothetical protein
MAQTWKIKNTSENVFYPNNICITKDIYSKYNFILFFLYKLDINKMYNKKQKKYHCRNSSKIQSNKGNPKRGVSPRLKIWHLTLKINRFQILLRTKYVPSLVKIHWMMLIL